MNDNQNSECISKLKGKMIECIMEYEFKINFEIDIDLRNESDQKIFEKISLLANMKTRSRLINFNSPTRVHLVKERLNILLLINKNEIEILKSYYELASRFYLNLKINFFWLDV